MKKEVCIRCRKDTKPLHRSYQAEGYIHDKCKQKEFAGDYKRFTGRELKV